jgi:two-component system, chemotaxis family, chemotaxis protein CheY
MESAAAPPQTAAPVPRKRAKRPAKSSARSTPAPYDERRLAGDDGGPPCVLIVDDDPATRLLCSINLQLEGLRVLEAADGRRGLARARFERPDLVLTDVKMPGLDGFQLAEALRLDERTRQIPLIFLSGETTAAHETRAHEAGALAYVTKPFDPPALASLVAGVLARSGTRERSGA